MWVSRTDAAWKLAAGGASSATSRILLAPLEVIRTVQQTAPPSQPPAPILAVGRRLWKQDGWRSLIKGTRAQLIKSVPEHGLRFGSFDALRNAIATDVASPTIGERLVAGGLAGALAQSVVYPLEVVKTRLTLAPAGTYRSVMDCAACIVRTGGYTSLLRGIGPSLVGIFPFAAIEQGLNSALKDSLRESRRARGEPEPSVGELLSCGVASSSVAAATTYPLHLVRTRVQASGCEGLPVHRNGWECARSTLATEGVRGFYRGLRTSLLKGAPSAALGWGMFELLCAPLNSEPRR